MDSDYDILIRVPDDAPAERKNPDAGYLAVEGLGRAAGMKKPECRPLGSNPNKLFCMNLMQTACLCS